MARRRLSNKQLAAAALAAVAAYTGTATPSTARTVKRGGAPTAAQMDRASRHFADNWWYDESPWLGAWAKPKGGSYDVEIVDHDDARGRWREIIKSERDVGTYGFSRNAKPTKPTKRRKRRR